MDFLKRMFSSSAPKKKSNCYLIYLDNTMKRSIETHDQTVAAYAEENQFEPDQFLYLLYINIKTDEIILRRKLNSFQRFSECLIPQPETRSFIVVGYQTDIAISRESMPSLGIDSMRFLRAGNIFKYSDSKGGFEECQLKLHHDYLTFYKLREKEKKISFMPLENSVVEIVNDKKNVFTVKDKFKSLNFKCTSKEDMFGWLVAITETIKIRNSQIYLNQLQERLNKAIKGRLQAYFTRCLSLKEQSRMISLDQIGRKALKIQFKQNKVPQIDSQLLSIIQAYLYMCKCRREKGQAYSEQIIAAIKASIKQLDLPQGVILRDVEVRSEFVKVIQDIMRHLDDKYRKQIVEKKEIYQVFEDYLTSQYKEDRGIPLKTLFGKEA